MEEIDITDAETHAEQLIDDAEKSKNIIHDEYFYPTNQTP